ncbi:hypothetical protein FIBSPDRAFT_928762 [Athelia psychrophila]|uniref:MARVEL domain-containing protein n=1 Tax=Athelia psychrophila TaxID=1759441 RepID=A0A166PQE1_9AGAM|nr:hypothetical protein FIBSPDRAFT_928762 [Fibularhizoctonia sp. CBS 109695]
MPRAMHPSTAAPPYYQDHFKLEVAIAFDSAQLLQVSQSLMQIPVHISNIASRSDEPLFSILLRLSTLALSAALFILSAVEVGLSGYWWFFIPSTVYLAWQTCILVLAHRGVKITLPVAITLDLLMWLSAMIFILFSFMVNAGFTYECDEPGGGYGGVCEDYWTAFRLSIASEVITGIILVIHFILFVRDIMVLRRAKRAAAKNFVELAGHSYAA